MSHQGTRTTGQPVLAWGNGTLEICAGASWLRVIADGELHMRLRGPGELATFAGQLEPALQRFARGERFADTVGSARSQMVLASLGGTTFMHRVGVSDYRVIDPLELEDALRWLRHTTGTGLDRPATASGLEVERRGDLVCLVFVEPGGSPVTVTLDAAQAASLRGILLSCAAATRPRSALLDLRGGRELTIAMGKPSQFSVSVVDVRLERVRHLSRSALARLAEEIAP